MSWVLLLGVVALIIVLSGIYFNLYKNKKLLEDLQKDSSDQALNDDVIIEKYLPYLQQNFKLGKRACYLIYRTGRTELATNLSKCLHKKFHECLEEQAETEDIPHMSYQC